MNYFRQLLLDCGIGLANNDESVISQHRALIFCQLKSMLDIIENDLFKLVIYFFFKLNFIIYVLKSIKYFRVHMSNVTYLRLDGSVPVSQRYLLVNRFNTDPSIDVLIMTTQVGGLGLNLTGADTVYYFYS